MAASSSAEREEEKRSNVVTLRRRSLTGEVAVVERGWGDALELFDVPALVLDSLASRSDLRMIEESDDEVQQCIETRIDTLLGIDWRLEGGSETVREWLTEELRRHYDEIVTNAWNAKLYGYSVQERIWAERNGYYVVDRVAEKPFEWFIPKRDKTLWFRKSSNLVLLPHTRDLSYPLAGEQVDTQFKFLLTRHKPTWKNPRGKALLAYLFWPWFYRKASWQFWMQFLERNGQPLLVGTGANPAQMADQLALAVQDAVIAVPINSKVEAIAPQNRGEAFGLAEDRLVRRIQKVLLGQTLTSDVATKGSGAKALGEVHNEVRLDKTIGDVKLVYSTVQNYVDALLALNFPTSRPVHLVYAIDRGLESARASRDAALANTGQVSFTEQYYQREYGFKPGDMVIMSVKEMQAAKEKQKEQEGNKQPGQDGKKKEEDEARHQELLGALVTAASKPQPVPVVNVAAPQVTVNPPAITVEAPVVNIHEPTPAPTSSTKTITGTQVADGQMVATVKEEFHYGK